MNKVTNLIQLAYRAGKVAKGDSLLVSIQKSQAKTCTCIFFMRTKPDEEDSG